MSHRTRALSLVLGALVVLSLAAGPVATVAAQTAGNDAPIPVLDAPDAIERGQLYELDGSASTGDIEEYRWDYDPNAPTAFQRGTERDTVYAEDRTADGQDQFTVRLGVADDEGNVAWTNETIDVVPSEDPEASIASSDDFTVEREQTEREPSWFNSTSTDDHGIRSCEWTFEYGPTVERTSGDGLGWGEGSTECNKSYAFPVPGTYNVTLTVEDWAGNTDTTTRQVEVVPKQEVTDDPQPDADLSAPDRVEWGATYWMNASNSTSEADVDYYIGEYNPDHWWSDERNLGHDTYYGAVYEGQFDRIDVAVGVLTVDGQTDWDWETIEILDPEAPDASLQGPDAVATGDLAEFDASNSTDNDRIRSYEWTVNDTETGGTVGTGSGATESHRFDEPGTYEVTVRVGDWVNHSREGPYHYGVASKTVTVGEDGDGGTNETETPTDTETPTETPDQTETNETETETETPTDTETETPDSGDSSDDDPSDSDGPSGGDGPSDDDSPDDGDNDDSDNGDSDSDDSSSSAGDGGGSGGTAPPADSGDDDATVDVEQVDERTQRVNVSGAVTDETVAVPLQSNASDGPVGFQDLSVRAAENESFSLTVTARDARTESDASAVEGFEALSNLAIEGNQTSGLDNATVEFTVSKARLDELDADADAVAFRRADDGESEAVDTALVNETGEAYVYRADPGTVTTYAVGLERAAQTETPEETATETTVTDTAGSTATATGTAETIADDGTPETAFGGVSGFGALAALLAVVAGAAVLVLRR